MMATNSGRNMQLIF